jgi:predicted PurR-regulated permease PerM
MKPEASSDVTRIVLLVLLIGLLLAGSLWTLLPFMGALIWATMIVIATWPLLLWVQQKTGGRRSVAVTILTILVLLAFIAPLALAISTLLDAAGRSPALIRDFLARGLGPPPEWLVNLPGVGEQFLNRWQELAAGGPEALADAVRPYARSAATWVVSATGGLGLLIVHTLLTVALVAILYAQREVAARGALAATYTLTKSWVAEGWPDTPRHPPLTGRGDHIPGDRSLRVSDQAPP